MQEPETRFAQELFIVERDESGAFIVRFGPKPMRVDAPPPLQMRTESEAVANAIASRAGWLLMEWFWHAQARDRVLDGGALYDAYVRGFSGGRGGIDDCKRDEERVAFALGVSHRAPPNVKLASKAEVFAAVRRLLGLEPFEEFAGEPCTVDGRELLDRLQSATLTPTEARAISALAHARVFVEPQQPE